jgi:thymidylate synthase
MKQYHELLTDILENGEEKDDRTGVGTISVFGRNLRFDLRRGFPAITTKKLAWKAVVGELLWFIEGSKDERRLAEITHGTKEGTVTIWTPNSLAPYWKNKKKFDGDVGRIYGVQWRRWRKPFNGGYVDQLENLINSLKNDPHGRRHILTAWNPGELDEMVLPPCHMTAQFYVNNNNELSCSMYQRSVDVFLGLPFNIASYALFTHMIAQVCNYKIGELIINMGDTHLYKNHIEQVKEQLARPCLALPALVLNPDIKNINDFTISNINLLNYTSYGPIKAEMAV